MCQGQTLSIQQNQALFSLLGTYYGGNGIQTFCLPNLVGCAALGQGNASFGTYVIGENGGTAGVTMTTANLPTHNHTATLQVPVNTDGPTTQSPVGGYLTTPDEGKMYAPAATANQFAQGLSITSGSQGGSTPVNVENPYLALSCCIATTGIYPSRN